MASRRPPLPLTTIPSDDPVFRRVVDRVAADSGARSPQELAERLRSLFPRVAVFERQLENERGLYVYRDGRYQRRRSDRWWEEPGVACVCISAATGRLTHVSGEYADLMGANPEDLVGEHYSVFVVPEARAVADSMFEALRDQPEVRSEALVRRPDGSTLTIEFRAARENGEIDVRYRPMP